MSINVTVTGNPVNIKRGKMITADPYTAKKEFEKRRLLRLEQVRQQSKELAQDVRDKVRKERKKQMGQIEKEGKEKLKNWKNRKLLELHNQYMDAIDEIGMGHKEAEQLADESEILEDQRLKNEEIAKSRGKLAETKLQVQKNEDNYKKAMPIQHKKLVRDVENTRAALVSSLKRKAPQTKKNKAKANINITVPNDSDFSEASSSDSSKHLPSIHEGDNAESEGFCECSTSSEENSVDSDVEDASATKRGVEQNTKQEGKVDSEAAKMPPTHPQELKPKQKSYIEALDERRKLIEDFKHRSREVPVDTRISDRIKRRQLMAAQPDYCDLIADPTPVPEIAEITKIRDKITSRKNNLPTKDPLELSSEECMCTKFHVSCPCKSKYMTASESNAVQTDGYSQNCKCRPKKGSKLAKDFHREQAEKPRAEEVSVHSRSDTTDQKVSSALLAPSEGIPSKPFVKLKNRSDQPSSKPGTGQSEEMADVRPGASRVRHYDHPNRFTMDLPSTSQVEKIGAESIEVIPDFTSEKEWHDKMKQRDKEAQARGRRALEKEKIQRDYEEMMKKLPMLQRKEHIAQIGTDKPEYHMSEERLKERERERQNRLENVYSKVVPDLKPQIVTLPRRNHEMPRSDEPFEILDGDDSRTLRLGKWDADTKPKTMFSAEEVQEIIKAFTVQKPEDRKAKLKQLLRSLKLQKEQLLNEIRALPKDDSIDALISDLTSFSDPDDKHERSSKHRSKDKGKSSKKRQLAESDTSNTSGEISTRGKKTKSKTRSKDNFAQSPYKKMKKPDPKVLILQNTSTQTTPKATKEKSSTTTTTTTSSSVQVSEQHLRIVDPEVSLPSGIRICTKAHVPCDCYKGKDGVSSEEVCKIYIKLNEEESPKVEVVKSARDSLEKESGNQGLKESKTVDKEVMKSPRKHSEKPSKSPKKEKRTKSLVDENKPPKETSKRIERKSVATETERPRKLVSERNKKVDSSKSSTQPAPEKKVSPSRSRNESWKEHLSRNSMSTSSTSYMSPPDFSRQNTTASTEASRQSLYNLRKKPQQTNIDRSSFRSTVGDSNIDRKLLNYIKQLLSMSKTSVDDLGVSSSDVPTPSQSIIEMESNNPLAALHNAIKLINLRAADIAKELSENENMHVPPNSSVTLSDSKATFQQGDSTEIPEKDTNGTSGDRAKASLLSEYAAVTDSCTKRIANLAAMIEQLRQEKIEMLDSPPLAQKTASQKSRSDAGRSPPPSVDLTLLTPTYSDKETSTKYFEFPPSGEKSKGTNSTASIDEEELNRRLLEIDMSLADKLKRFGQSKNENGQDDQLSPLPTLRDQQPQDPTSVSENQLNQTDQQFLQRLQRLMQESHEKEQPEPESPLPQVNLEVPFIPFLSDIPKLPILAPEPEDLGPSREKRHPPPSKGLISAKKFNGDISLIPHELSTIVEADSQISTRISPNNSRTATSIAKDTVPPLSLTDKSSARNRDISPVVVEEKSRNESNKPVLKSPATSVERISLNKNADESDTSKSFACTEGTCSSLSTSSSKHRSSSSSSDMKSIEAMLKSIGMDWAIPTLHKTQEALALSSSSSSGDLSSKKKSARKSISSSEVSLREFLKKQMVRRISSSSLIKSGESPASFVKDCSEISAIQVNSSTEKAKQRTSTPVLSSKSASQSKEEQHQFFAGASEISSVRNSSCDSCCNKSSGKQTFHSLAGEDDASSTKYSIEK